MKNFYRIALFAFYFLGTNISISQSEWKTKTISVPIVKNNTEELIKILDTIMIAEKKCAYYSDSLLVAIDIRISPEGDEMSLDFETQNEKYILLGVNPIGYFKYKKHDCFIYFNLPSKIFIKTNSLKTFKYQRKAHPEDDSFSHWLYYFHKDQFYLDNYVTHCGE